MRKLLLITAACALTALPCFGENLHAALIFTLRYKDVNANSVAAGTINGQARDMDNAGLKIKIRACVDDSSANCKAGISGNFVEVMADEGYPDITQNGDNWNFQVGVIGTVGSINVKDGNYHTWYIYAVSPTSDDATHNMPVDFAGRNSSALTGSGIGFPVAWDIANNNLKEDYLPDLSASSAIQVAQLATIVDTNSAASVGSAGATVCAGGTTATGSTAIKDDSYVGYWASKYSFPCNQIYEVAWTVGVNQLVSSATFISVMDSTLRALPSTIQYIGLGWLRPLGVTGTGNSGWAISGYTMMYLKLSSGAPPSGSTCLDDVTRAPGQSFPLNDFLNSGTNNTPFTTYGIRPVVMMAAAKCTTPCSNNAAANAWVDDPTVSWKNLVDASFSERNSNTSGTVAQVPWTSDSNGGLAAYQFPPYLAGSVISPNVNYKLIGTQSAPSNQNPTAGTAAGNIFYANGTATNTFQSTFAAAPGGLYTNDRSFSGALDSSMTPSIAAMYVGTGGLTATPPFEASAGTIAEPCESSYRKRVNSPAYLRYLFAGWPVGTAYWKSSQDAWDTNIYTDPFDKPYSSPSGNPAAGPSVSGSVVFIGNVSIRTQ